MDSYLSREDLLTYGLFTRAIFGLFVAQHRDWRRRPTATQHPKRRRGGCWLKWNLSQWFLTSDTVIDEAATQCPVDELVLTFHLVYRHSSVCQFPASIYLGHLRTPCHWANDNWLSDGHVNTLLICLPSAAAKLMADTWPPQIARVNTALDLGQPVPLGASGDEKSPVSVTGDSAGSMPADTHLF